MERPAEHDLHALVDEFFYPGPTAEIGCGAGENTDWLNRHGFQAIGFDADEALVEAARRAHPQVDFARAGLPELAGIPSSEFTNVLCARALVELDADRLDDAVARLLDILSPDGTLLMSVPGSLAAPDALPSDLERVTILHESTGSDGQSGRTVHRIVARKHGGR